MAIFMLAERVPELYYMKEGSPYPQSQQRICQKKKGTDRDKEGEKEREIKKVTPNEPKFLNRGSIMKSHQNSK